MITIICLLGRSGSGKTRIQSCLEKLGFNRSISYTTRKQEKGEINGKNYHFVNKEDFFTLVKKNIIMEWAEYDGEYYGSPHPIGYKNNVLVVETHGYESIKKIYGKQAVGVYIDVPLETAQDRAIKRGRKTPTELIQQLDKRKITDDLIFTDIRDKVDIVIDGTKDVQSITAEIIKYVTESKQY